MKQIWSLFTNVGSLWVAFIHANLLKDKCFWKVKIPQECTWSCGAILKLRDEARKFIKFEVGDGETIFLWHDLWHLTGVLVQRFGSRVIYDVASNPEAKVDFVLKDKTWNWRLARFDALVTSQSQLFLVELKDKDKALWQATKSGKFSCAAAYAEIRDKSSEVEWWKLVWFHLTIPKHSFIGWLAIINKLSMRDRMAKWGYLGDSLCVFCRNCLESRDHIFFECSFTRRIWDDMMKLCLVSNAQFVWEDLIAWGVRELKGKGLRVIACKLAWWATVYHIWLQRNAIVHEERIWTEEQLKRSIIKDVKARLGFKTKFKKSVLNATICCNWGIDPSSILI